MKNLNRLCFVFFVTLITPEYYLLAQSIDLGSAYIRTDKIQYKPEERIEVSYYNFPENPKYYVGYFKVYSGFRPEKPMVLTNGKSDGKIEFIGSKPGKYEIRVYDEERSRIILKYPFRVCWWYLLDLTEIIKILISLLLPGLAWYVYRKYGKLIQQTEAGKSYALGEVSFQYNATHRIHKHDTNYFLDLKVKITNVSSRKLGIPAVFTHFKPILDTLSIDKTKFINFEELQAFQLNEYSANQTINKIKNIAAAKGFFWQTSIGGISIRRGYELFDHEFVNRYPLIMLRIIIYGTSLDLIDKTSFPEYKVDILRVSWCEFLDNKNKENYDYFDRLKEEKYIHPERTILKGERILVNNDEKRSIDIENTIRYFNIIKSIVSSFVELVINFKEDNTENND